MKKEILRVSHLSIRSGHNVYLPELNFSLRQGEILGLFGLSPEQRELLLRYFMGKPLNSSGQLFSFGAVSSPADTASSVCCIHTQSVLVGGMTIAENLFAISRRDPRPVFLCNRKSLNKQCQALLDQYGLALSADTAVEELSPFGRIAVELMGAVIRGARIILYNRSLDELPLHTFSQLQSLMRSLSAADIAVVLLCGQPARMLQLSTRITAVKNGVSIQTFISSRTTNQDLSQTMLGIWDKPDVRTDEVQIHQKTLFAVRGLRLSMDDRPMDLEIRSGEIVGIIDHASDDAGNILRALYGLQPCSCQHLSVCGRVIPTLCPSAAFSGGMMYIQNLESPQDLLPHSSVRTNIVLPLIRPSSAFGGRLRSRFLDTEVAQTAAAVGLTEAQLLQPLSPELLLPTQLARILLSHRSVLLLNNPFSGLAPADDYLLKRFLVDFGKAGNCVLFSSTYFPDFAAEGCRCYQVDHGRLVKYTPAELRESQVKEGL